tara:strand:+ start:2068 stop:2268 length:201 start_codon:yes stop_codon:yes gene_type:complete
LPSNTLVAEQKEMAGTCDVEPYKGAADNTGGRLLIRYNKKRRSQSSSDDPTAELQHRQYLLAIMSF